MNQISFEDLFEDEKENKQEKGRGSRDTCTFINIAKRYIGINGF